MPLEHLVSSVQEGPPRPNVFSWSRFRNLWLRPLVALAIGLGLIAWSVFWLYPSAPEPAEPVAPTPSVSSPAPEDTPAEDEQAETDVAPEEPVVLYPVKPLKGEQIGTITLPSLDQSWPILEGTDEAQLAKGVGHFEQSVLPGIRDNSVLSGHRTSVFNELGELEAGDLIVVATDAGVFSYQVREFRIVDRSSRDVIVPTETAILTLTTCYPFNSLFRTSQAFIVTAELIESQIF